MPDPAKVEVITKWPTPKTTKQVKSFLGTTNYYLLYLKGYAQRSAALRELTAKDKPFVWGEAQEKSFNYDLKTALSTPPILRFQNSNREYLETDASGDGIGYICGQFDDEGRKYVVIPMAAADFVHVNESGRLHNWNVWNF